MRRYELVVLMDEDTNEKTVVNTIHKIVEDNKGQIEDKEIIKEQKLAYPIMDKEQCNVYKADCYFNNIEDVENTTKELNNENDVLRYLLCIAS